MEITSIFEQTKSKLLGMEAEFGSRELIKVVNSPMGDFDYDLATNPMSSECSSSDFTEEIRLNNLYDSNKEILETLSKNIELVYNDIDMITERVDITGEDILQRRDHCREMKRLCFEFIKQIAKETEQLEKIDFLINYLENSLNTRATCLEKYRIVEINPINATLQQSQTDLESDVKEIPQDGT